MICGVAYVDGRDAVGQDRLVPMQSAPPSEDTNRLSAPTVGSSTATATQVAIDRGKGKARHDAPLSAVRGSLHIYCQVIMTLRRTTIQMCCLKRVPTYTSIRKR